MRKIIFILSAFPFLIFGDDCLETRASIHLGMAYSRLVVAEVDKCKSSIAKYYLEKGSKIDFISRLKETNNILNQTVETNALREIKKLAENARVFRPKNLILIPTKSFKHIKNHMSLFKKIQKTLNIKVVLPNLETESILGFLAAKLKVPQDKRPIMVWNIDDSGSFWAFEGTDKEFRVFSDKISPIIFKDMVIEGILKKDHNKVASPNPLGPQKVKEAENILDIYLKYNLNKFLQEQSSNFKIVGIGNFHSLSVYPQSGSKMGAYHPDQLQAALEKTSNFSDKEIGGEFPQIQITNLILALRMMERMKIGEVFAISVNQAHGALIYENYWKPI